MLTGDSRIAYLNGSFLPFPECVVPIDCHTLQYGTGCFEGIRAYWNAEAGRPAVLLMREHYDRLRRNARMLLMDAPPLEELCESTKELLRRNRVDRNTYIRPVVYKNCNDIGPALHNLPNGYFCYLMPLEDYIDTAKGLDLCVSSWRRIGDNQIPTRAKATGAYINSALAKSEAMMNGFDEAVFLNERGQVCEGSAENLFLIRHERLITPDRAADILEGITRNAVLELAAGLGLRCEERPVSRTELYHADELFLVGTGCQISWVHSVDRRTVGTGTIGPVTLNLQQAYEAAVYGRDPAREHWLSPA